MPIPLPCTYCQQPAQFAVTGDSDRGYWSAGACQQHLERAKTRASQAGRVTVKPLPGAPPPDQPDLFTTTENGDPA